jgi:rhodanese-related sulfurtransferase
MGDAQRQLRHYEDKLAFEIDSWDLHVALRAGEPVIVVDARSPDAYRREHIPGARNLPHRAIDADVASRLDRDALLVAYCDGIGCNASSKGALALLRLGFRVKELIGGLDWWKRDGHPTHGEALEASEASAQRAEGERSHQATAAPACGCASE